MSRASDAIASINHHSVDPPRTKRSLFVPYIPTRYKPTRKHALRVAGSEPFKSLPRVLVPNRRLPMKPPKMHYGWVAKPKKLLEYAALVLPKVLPRSREERIQERDKKRSMKALDDYDDEDEDEDEDDPDRPFEHTWEYFTSMERAAMAAAVQCGGQFPLSLIEISSALLYGDCLIISLFTNSDLARPDLPSEDDIKKLQEFLGEPEGPRWYTNELYWTWNPWYGRW